MRREDILASLPSMSKDDLRDLAARASFLAGGGPSAPADRGSREGGDVDLLNEAINAALGGRGLPTVHGGALGRLRHYDKMCRAAEILGALVTNSVTKKRGAERLVAFTRLVEVVADRVAGSNAPLCHKTVVDGTLRIHEAIEDAFPGYLAADLLRSVILRPYSKTA